MTYQDNNIEEQDSLLSKEAKVWSWVLVVFLAFAILGEIGNIFSSAGALICIVLLGIILVAALPIEKVCGIWADKVGDDWKSKRKIALIVMFFISFILIGYAGGSAGNNNQQYSKGNETGAGTQNTVKECEHTWKAATCVDAKTCTKCGKREGSPLGHRWQPATCTKAMTCSVCGKTDGSPAGHKVSEYIVTLEATCGTSGKEEGTCSVCGEIIERTIQATGKHTVNKWTVTEESTCTKHGHREGVCTVCGTKLNEELELLEHVDDNTWVVTKAPGKSLSGERSTHCKNCGKVMQSESFTITKEQYNAMRSAESYLAFMAFSRKGLIDQLVFEGYSRESATIAVDSLIVDWYEQAVKKAQDYLDFMAFSRSGLIEQLIFEGFTRAQAEYACTQVGY